MTSHDCMDHYDFQNNHSDNLNIHNVHLPFFMDGQLL
jgi:hypothetical protein